jgi:hypothetical protein
VGRFYNNPVGLPKSLSISPQKNLFQAVDILIMHGKTLFN